MFNFGKKDRFTPSRKILDAYRAVRADTSTPHLCNAPFRSLLFIPTGEMMVCHYNRGYQLGKYPNNSIEEVWQGDKLKALRNCITNHDLSAGCQACFYDLSIKNFRALGASKYDFIPANGPGFPSLMEFQLSNTCNLECVMCSGEYSSGIRANREKEAPYISPYDDDFVNTLKIFIPHLKKAYFTGGEPFIIPIYRKIWQLILGLNPDIEINISTNAFALDDDIKTLIEKGRFNFTVSIDSLHPEHYENIRKNARFARVMENIAYLRNYSERHQRVFSVKFIVIRQNMHDIPELFNYFNEQQVQLFPKLVDLPYKYSLLSLTSDTLENILNEYQKPSFSSDTVLKEFNLNRFGNMTKTLTGWYDKVVARESDKALKNATAADLKQGIYLNIEAFLKAQKTFATNEKAQLLAELEGVFDKVEQKITGSEALHSIYFAYYAIDPRLICAELMRNPAEKLVARFIEEASV